MLLLPKETTSPVKLSRNCQICGCPELSRSLSRCVSIRPEGILSTAKAPRVSRTVRNWNWTIAQRRRSQCPKRKVSFGGTSIVGKFFKFQIFSASGYRYTRVNFEFYRFITSLLGLLLIYCITYMSFGELWRHFWESYWFITSLLIFFFGRLWRHSTYFSKPWRHK